MTAPYTAPPGSVPTLRVPDLDGIAAVHLMGIGGAGMNGIARLLLARGLSVSGCDLKESRAVDALRGLGATLSIGHDLAHVGRPDAVVVSSAIPAENPELSGARSAGIP